MSNTDRKQIAESEILETLSNSPTPWKVIGRSVVISRACGCFKQIYKRADKGAMEGGNMVKFCKIIATTYCEKCKNEFLLTLGK